MTHFKNIGFIYCVSLCACGMCMLNMYEACVGMGPGRGCLISWNWSYKFGDWNLGPLEYQEVLTTETSLQLLHIYVLNNIKLSGK